ncbi:MAG: extracellular solute-binding protein [Halobacteriales archaeon]
MQDDTTNREIARRRLLQMTGAGLTAGLAGCAGGGGGGGGGSGPTTIGYRDRGDSYAAYAHKYDNNTEGVEIEYTVANDRYQGILPKIKAGQPIQEVLGVDIVQFPKMVELGALRDISDFYSSLEYTDDFLGRTDPLFTTWNDSKYAVPFWIDLSLMFYNKKQFRQAGLDPESPPQTWSELEQALKTLQSVNKDRPPLGASFASGLSEFFFLPYAWSNGGGWFSDGNRNKVTIGSQPNVEALEFWVDINEQGLATDLVSTQWMNWHNMFVNEDVPIMFSGGFGLGHVKDNNSEMFNNYLGTAMFPSPEGGTRSSFLGGNNLAITTSAEGDKLAAAKEFVRWVNTEPGMKTTLDLGYMPGRQTGFNVGIATEEPFNTLFGPFETALKQGRVPIHPKFEEIALPIRSAIQKALSGKASAESALMQAQQKINSDVLG